jgi:hypothetical protein
MYQSAMALFCHIHDSGPGFGDLLAGYLWPAPSSATDREPPASFATRSGWTPMTPVFTSACSPPPPQHQAPLS